MAETAQQRDLLIRSACPKTLDRTTVTPLGTDRMDEDGFAQDDSPKPQARPLN